MENMTKRINKAFILAGGKGSRINLNVKQIGILNGIIFFKIKHNLIKKHSYKKRLKGFIQYSQ